MFSVNRLAHVTLPRSHLANRDPSCCGERGEIPLLAQLSSIYFNDKIFMFTKYRVRTFLISACNIHIHAQNNHNSLFLQFLLSLLEKSL